MMEAFNVSLPGLEKLIKAGKALQFLEEKFGQRVSDVIEGI